MNCPTCNNNLLENAKFCNKCGTRVQQSAGRQEVAAQSPSHVAAPRFRPREGQPHVQAAPAETAVTISTDWLSQAFERLGRIARLDSAMFAELKSDASANVFALMVPAVAIVLMGMGGYLWVAIEFDATTEVFWKSVLVGSVIAYIVWLSGMMAAYMILTSFYKEELRPEEVLRVGGAASAPLAIGFFMFIPGISFGVSILAMIAWAVYTAVAFRSGLGVALERAAMSALVAFAVWMLVMPLIVNGDNPIGPGLLLFDSLKDSLADWYQGFS